MFAACVAIEPSPRFVRAVLTDVRSDRLSLLVNLVPMLVVIVLAKLASLPRAAASSWSVSSAAPAPFTKFEIAVVT